MPGMTLRDYQNRVDEISLILQEDDGTLSFDQRQRIVREREQAEGILSACGYHKTPEEILGHPV